MEVSSGCLIVACVLSFDMKYVDFSHGFVHDILFHRAGKFLLGRTLRMMAISPWTLLQAFKVSSLLVDALP